MSGFPRALEVVMLYEQVAHQWAGMWSKQGAPLGRLALGKLPPAGLVWYQCIYWHKESGCDIEVYPIVRATPRSRPRVGLGKLTIRTTGTVWD